MRNFRTEELATLHRLLELENIVALKGPQGIGKKTLVKLYIRDKKCKFLWKKNFISGSLAEAFGFSAQSFEESLDKISETITDVPLVIWENIEDLSRQDLDSLLHHLSIFSDQKHIVICKGEKHFPSFRDFLNLELKAFDFQTCSEYIQHNFRGKYIDTQEAYRFSKGIPLRVNMFSQNLSLDSVEKFSLEDLSSEAKSILYVSYFTGSSHRLSELSSLLSFSEEALRPHLENLNKAYLVDWDGESFQSPFQHSDFCKSYLEKEEKSTLAREVIEKILLSGHDFDGVYKLKLALTLNNLDLFNSTLEKIDVNSLESKNLNLIKSIANKLLQKKELPHFDNPTQVRRIGQILYIGQQRQAALSYLQNYIQRMGPKFGFDKDQAFVALDHLRFLNRTGNTQKVIDETSKLSNKIHRELTPFMHIEKGVAVGDSNRERALSCFDEALQLSKNIPHLDSNQDLIQEITSLAEFERARILNSLERYEEARLAFQHAFAGFTHLKKHYHAAVVKLNDCWLLLKSSRWEELHIEIEILARIADKYSFRNVQAGLEIVKATKHRHFLNIDNALEALDRCSRLLDENSPVSSLSIYYTERVRLYLQLNLDEEAKYFAEKLYSLATEKKATFFKKIAENLLFFSSLMSLDAHEILDQLNGFLEEDDFEIYDIPVFFPLLESPPEKLFGYLEKSPLGRLKVLERKILTGVTESDPSIWGHIREFDNITSHYSEPHVDRVFIKLIQLELSKEESSNQYLLDEAKIELCRISSSNQWKSFYEHWWRALHLKQNPLLQVSWTNAPSFVKLKFRKLLQSLYREKKQQYILMDQEGERFQDQLPSISSSPLVVIEDTHEVYVHGKAILTMIRKSSLLKLLSTLLSSYPRSVNKIAISRAVWGEDYDPSLHDSRIYTSIQRLRNELKLKKAILNEDGSYKWSPKQAFVLVKSADIQARKLQRHHNLILSALQGASQNKEPFLTRKDLSELTSSSDATVKRELVKLIELGLIHRHGSGRAVKYSIA